MCSTFTLLVILASLPCSGTLSSNWLAIAEDNSRLGSDGPRHSLWPSLQRRTLSLVRLRGGFPQPSKAFTPQEALPETNRTIVPAGPKYAWFYPDPPWGRKDKCMPGSKFLQLWHAVVWCAMMYIAVIIPFQAAGFTIDPHARVSLWDSLMADRSVIDGLVDLIFITDIVFSLHTATYDYRGHGQLVLIHKLSDIRKRYLKSNGFFWDLCGVVPFQALILVLSRVSNLFRKQPVQPFATDPQIVNLFKILRLAKLCRLYHFQRMWTAIHHRFPGK